MIADLKNLFTPADLAKCIKENHPDLVIKNIELINAEIVFDYYYDQFQGGQKDEKTGKPRGGVWLRRRFVKTIPLESMPVKASSHE